MVLALIHQKVLAVIEWSNINYDIWVIIFIVYNSLIIGLAATHWLDNPSRQKY